MKSARIQGYLRAKSADLCHPRENKSVLGGSNEQEQHVPNVIEEREQVKSSGGKPKGESDDDQEEISPKEENTTSMTSDTKIEDESHEKVSAKASAVNSAKSSSISE